MTDLTAPHFTDEEKAREYLEALRWPNGVVCPHCGVQSGHYQLKGGAHRIGLWKCKDCREQFSVTVGTVFERSKIKLNKWLLAVHLMCASKKGISAHQIHRMLRVTYKTAWFMCHRIREAMKPEGGGLLGSAGGAVEAELGERISFGEISGQMVAAGRYRNRPAIQIRAEPYGFIWCQLSETVIDKFVSEHKMADVWEGRTIGVEGRLFYASGGKLSKIEVTSIREIYAVPPIDLDSVLDPTFTAGLDPADYLEKLHEGELA